MGKKEIYEKTFGGNDNGDVKVQMSGAQMKALKKMNDLNAKAVHYLSKFVHIFEFPPGVGVEKKTERAEIAEESRFEYFQAHFLMAVLYGKMAEIGHGKAAVVGYIRKSLSGYEHVSKFYADKGPIDGCDVQADIAKEMK